MKREVVVPSAILRPLRQLRLLLLALCGSLAVSAPGAAHASSLITNEGTLLHGISIVAGIYSKEHGGRAPASWEDLRLYLPKLTPQEEPLVLRYAFLPEPVSLEHDTDFGPGVSLHLITRRPFREVRIHSMVIDYRGLSQPGRYAVIRLGDGQFMSQWLNEKKVQAIFRGREHLLPPPDTEPMRERELELWCTSIIRGIIAVGLALLVVHRLIRRIPRLWSRAARAARPEENVASL